MKALVAWAGRAQPDGEPASFDRRPITRIDPGRLRRVTYWFKRRRFGYGWTPSTWQGWALVVILIALIVAPIPFLPQGEDQGGPNPWAYLFYVLVVIVVFILIALKKGPAPRWRWGRTDHDNPDEDF